ncbi:hypothetical protein N9N67_11620 [Bacteriovoracaceae bacterium]|nr:hypothetical protein [Bacteriovoracaceae bacterium]
MKRELYSFYGNKLSRSLKLTRMNLKQLILTISLFPLSLIQAGDVFEINDRSFTGTLSGGVGDTLFDQLETELNSGELDLDQTDFVRGMGGANILAGKGQGTDYANHFDLFLISASTGFGIDTGDNEFDELDEGVPGGISILPNIAIGLPGALFKLDKTDFFFNFTSGDITSVLEGSLSEDLVISGEASGFGFHIRHQLMPKVDVVPFGVLRWGGVFIHAGIVKSELDLEMTLELDDETVTDDDADATASFTNAEATLGAISNTQSIPIEVSTYVQLMYIMTFYTGFGIDFNSGYAESTAEIEGDINATATGGTGSGTAEIEVGDKENVESSNTRSFVGFQFNLPLLKVFAEVNKKSGKNAVGLNFGLKATW